MAYRSTRSPQGSTFPVPRRLLQAKNALAMTIPDPFHCEAAVADEAIPTRIKRGDCFASLAMTTMAILCEKRPSFLFLRAFVSSW